MIRDHISRRYPLYIIAILGSGVGMMAMAAEGIDHEAVRSFLGEAASNQITQAGFFFTMAAWLHSGRVKKEIKTNFLSLTEAINNVAESLKEDLKKHSEKIEKHSSVLDNLYSRVQDIENNLKLKQGS